jgi:hypothetical protein
VQLATVLVFASKKQNGVHLFYANTCAHLTEIHYMADELLIDYTTI